MQTCDEKDTRCQIMEAAIRLFTSQGYDGTSIRDIVAATGVTKPVLYYYFKNKEDLYLSIIKESYAQLFELLTPILESDCHFKEKLRQVTKLYFDITESSSDIIRIIYDALFFPKKNKPPVAMIWEEENKHQELIKILFRQGMAEKIIRNGDVEQVVNHYFGAINIYMMIHMTEQRTLPQHLDEVVLDFVMNGLKEGK